MGGVVYVDRRTWEEMMGAIRRINEICHTPSAKHPQGNRAYGHFMADFDEIRSLCKPWLEKGND